MSLLTATEVTVLSNISVSAGTILGSTLIADVTANINMITNNYFTLDLSYQGNILFDGSAGTLLADSSFEDENFLAGDDIYVYNSYRNDGYFTIASVSSSTLTLISGSTVVNELSGRSILVSVVRWPKELKRIAAQMIAFDYDYRGQKGANVKSFSLGPFSESYTVGNEDEFGYPSKLTNPLSNYLIGRLM
jgi:hypothetical protein